MVFNPSLVAETPILTQDGELRLLLVRVASGPIMRDGCTILS
jgi:hypothetical protein